MLSVKVEYKTRILGNVHFNEQWTVSNECISYLLSYFESLACISFPWFCYSGIRELSYSVICLLIFYRSRKVRRPDMVVYVPKARRSLEARCSSLALNQENLVRAIIQ